MIRISGLRSMTRAIACCAAIGALAVGAGSGAWPGPGAARADGQADAAEAQLNHGRVLLFHLLTPAGGPEPRSVRVCLPRSYTESGHEKRRYPAVYLLHGWPGGDGNWPGQGRAATTLDSLSAAGRIPEVVAVMPNGSGAGLWGRSLFLNSYDGRQRLEDFVSHDLVAWADSMFRTVPDSAHRAVIGLSEGATAALNIAFKHPRVFGACGGLSGQYELANDVGMKAVFGPEPGGTVVRQQNSPTLYADRIAGQLKRQVIYFDCGLDDGELEDNRALHQKLEALGVPHTYREYPGHHGWTYWRNHLRDALIACLGGMRGSAP
ncbi:MAG: alpha/beta hydrolase [Candidatus Eiseniibacteriota bacterium]